MLAKAVAAESGANFLNISMSSLASKWCASAAAAPYVRSCLQKKRSAGQIWPLRAAADAAVRLVLVLQTLYIKPPYFSAFVALKLHTPEVRPPKRVEACGSR